MYIMSTINYNKIYNLFPTPAIANAVFNAVGVRIRNLPITPEKVLRGIGSL